MLKDCYRKFSPLYRHHTIAFWEGHEWRCDEESGACYHLVKLRLAWALTSVHDIFPFGVGPWWDPRMVHISYQRQHILRYIFWYSILPCTSVYILYSLVCWIIESTLPCALTVFQMWSYVELSHNLFVLLLCTKIMVNAFLFAHTVGGLLVDIWADNASICRLPVGIIICQDRYCLRTNVELAFWFEIDGLCWQKVFMLMPNQQVRYWQKVAVLMPTTQERCWRNIFVLCLTHPIRDPRTFFVSRKKRFDFRPWPLGTWFRRLVLGDGFAAFGRNMLTNGSKVLWWDIWNDVSSCPVEVSWSFVLLSMLVCLRSDVCKSSCFGDLS